MKPTDVRIVAAVPSFRPVPFAVPLTLSSGPITGLTEATVTVSVEARNGRTANGVGSVLLSHPWAGGTDDAMRATVRSLAATLPAFGTADPLQHGARLLDLVARSAGPRLAAEVAAGPVDQAVHDAWARAAGLSAYRMYTEQYLNADLGSYLGPDFAGDWPDNQLSATPATTLPVQHVLGVAEPAADAAGRRWIKLKLTGRVDADIERVRAVSAHGARLALDPNEAYTDPAALARLLDSVHAEYVEQPVPRGAPGPGTTGPLPVLADEGLPDPRDLDTLTGWDGIVVKTCRGQSSALLAYCWARKRQRFVVQQDLTHVGPALAHAAVFAAHCSYSVPAFECNSLQYAPAGNAELAVERPGLVTERDGRVEVSASGVGIR
ncbi:enolase C-terminal domain-like protein [Catenulispora pinisilvae]|uniref:enolase C-terminal domain-like protein n=1 Tax=Catenulispora pinisilvae TaxID=2705253 RepID=UPI0018915C16|nr:enolase C-terminal domain-like protein [Catenulispora pinisilvae]